MNKNTKLLHPPYKIGIVGPESTGKSDLCRALQQHLSCDTVTEYAREYLSTHGLAYTQDDVLHIAEQQYQRSILTIQKTTQPFVIMDTTMIVLKIWLQNAYNAVPSYILEHERELQIDAYLLCNIDLPWQEDPMREHPHLRNHFLNLYNTELIHTHKPYYLISGTGAARTEEALRFIQSIFPATS